MVKAENSCPRGHRAQAPTERAGIA
jgi:hypothetical protein